MNPESLAALDRLTRASLLPAATSEKLRRIAQGARVPIRTELRLFLYVSVLLISTGVGLLIKENLERIGPLGISLSLAFAAAACLFYVARRAAPFTWGRAADQHMAIDYVLLLSMLLLTADLTYIERTFPLFDSAWALHLLVMSIVAVALGARFDSRTVFALGLSSFAAWRGVSANTLEQVFWASSYRGVSLNSLGCGVLFVGVGWLLLRTKRKAHFEPSATYLGWMLVLGALFRLSWPLLTVTGVGLAVLGSRVRRYWLFALGVAGAYVGAGRFVTQFLRDDIAQALWFLLSSIAVMALLIRKGRRWQEATKLNEAQP
mgnify:CR=1 FL=1